MDKVTDKGNIPFLDIRNADGGAICLEGVRVCREEGLGKGVKGSSAFPLAYFWGNG